MLGCGHGLMCLGIIPPWMGCPGRTDLTPMKSCESCGWERFLRPFLLGCVHCVQTKMTLANLGSASNRTATWRDVFLLTFKKNPKFEITEAKLFAEMRRGRLALTVLMTNSVCTALSVSYHLAIIARAEEWMLQFWQCPKTFWLAPGTGYLKTFHSCPWVFMDHSLQFPHSCPHKLSEVLLKMITRGFSTA